MKIICSLKKHNRNLIARNEKSRRRNRRVPRFAVLVIGLWGMFCVILALMPHGTTTMHDCIYYFPANRYDPGTPRLLDLTTGASMFSPSTYLYYPKGFWGLSPNKKFSGYFEASKIGQGKVLVLGTQGIVNVGKPTLPDSTLVWRTYINENDTPLIHWSPDSRFFVYMSESDVGAWYAKPGEEIGIFRIQDQHLEQITLNFRSKHYPYFHGWSADSKYFATGSFDPIGLQERIIVWTADGQFVSSQTFGRILSAWDRDAELPYASDVRWSPSGQWLAYLSTESLYHYSLHIVAPNGHVVQEFQLPDPLDDARLEWSPDDAHVSVLGRPYFDMEQHILDFYRFQLNVFDTNGLQLLRISNGVNANLTYGAGGDHYGVMEDWTQDGQSIVFVQGRQTGPKSSQDDLMIFHLATQETVRLVENMVNVYPDVHRPNQNHLIMQWSDNQTIYAGLYDVTSERHTLIAKRTSDVK